MIPSTFEKIEKKKCSKHTFIYETLNANFASKADAIASAFWKNWKYLYRQVFRREQSRWCLRSCCKATGTNSKFIQLVMWAPRHILKKGDCECLKLRSHKIFRAENFSIYEKYVCASTDNFFTRFVKQGFSTCGPGVLSITLLFPNHQKDNFLKSLRFLSSFTSPTWKSEKSSRDPC